MAEIIEFPGGAERLRRYAERAIAESLHNADPNVKRCIKQRVGETLSRFPGIPSFPVTIPLSLSIADQKILIEALSKGYNEHVSKFAMELVSEICVLQAKLCRYEHGNGRNT